VDLFLGVIVITLLIVFTVDTGQKRQDFLRHQQDAAHR